MMNPVEAKQRNLDCIDLMRQTGNLHLHCVAAVHIEGGLEMDLEVAVVEAEGEGHEMEAGHGWRRRWEWRERSPYRYVLELFQGN